MSKYKRDSGRLQEFESGGKAEIHKGYQGEQKLVSKKGKKVEFEGPNFHKESQKKLTDMSTEQTRSRKESDVHHDLSGKASYKKYEGQEEKFACLVKSNEGRRDRRMISNDSMTSSSGISIRQKDQVKASNSIVSKVQDVKEKHFHEPINNTQINEGVGKSDSTDTLKKKINTSAGNMNSSTRNDAEQRSRSKYDIVVDQSSRPVARCDSHTDSRSGLEIADVGHDSSREDSDHVQPQGHGESSSSSSSEDQMQPATGKLPLYAKISSHGTTFGSNIPSLGEGTSGQKSENIDSGVSMAAGSSKSPVMRQSRPPYIVGESSASGDVEEEEGKETTQNGRKGNL